jgi:prevent-host-death family protein
MGRAHDVDTWILPVEVARASDYNGATRRWGVPTIGVRELKERATEVVRSVREDLAEFIVTWRGTPVAVLRPLSGDEVERTRSGREAAALRELDAISVAVGAAWTSSLSGTEAVAEQRR